MPIVEEISPLRSNNADMTPFSSMEYLKNRFTFILITRMLKFALRTMCGVWTPSRQKFSLRKECHKTKKPAVAVIGTSGEKISLISGIVNDGGRIAARSGGGAVMGSKRLKAVVLAGTKTIGCDDPKAMKVISKELSIKIRKANMPVKGGVFSTHGSLCWVG